MGWCDTCACGRQAEEEGEWVSTFDGDAEGWDWDEGTGTCRKQGGERKDRDKTSILARLERNRTHPAILEEYWDRVKRSESAREAMDVWPD